MLTSLIRSMFLKLCGSLSFLGSLIVLPKVAKSYTYDWSGGKETTDPRYPNGPPTVGQCKRIRVTLNGEDVSHWPIQKLTTGVTGEIVVVILPIKPLLHVACKQTFPGNVTLEIEEK